MKSKKRALTVAVLVVIVLAAGAVVAVRELSSSGNRLRTVPGSVLPALAHAHRLGAVPPSTSLIATVGLRVPGEASLLAALHASSHSLRTGHQNLSVPASEIATVEGYLRSHGLSVSQLRRGAVTIEASGSASDMESAFGSELSDWRQGRETFFANDSALALPADVAHDVTGVLGLDDYGRAQPGIWGTCHFIGPFATCTGGETPNPITAAQLRRAYGATALIGSASCGASRDAKCDGSGEQVAIFAANGLDMQAIWTFDQRYDQDPAAAIVVTSFTRSGSSWHQVTTVCPMGPRRTGTCGPRPTRKSTTAKTNEFELDLDIESVQTVAPKATIDLVEFPTTLKLFASYLSLFLTFEADRAPVLSISFGGCETGFSGSELTEINDELGVEASYGQSVFAGSGDHGEKCTTGSLGLGFGGKIGVEFPASATNITSVGGTALTLRKSGAYAHEIPWDATTEGSGGGVSQHFGTSVPDVAASATFYGYGWWDNTFHNINGTSVSTPLWAGAAALIDQYGRSRIPGYRLGLAYPALDAIDQHQVEPGIHAITRTGNTGALYTPTPIPHSVGIGSFTVFDLARELVPTVDVTALATADGKSATLQFHGAPYSAGSTVEVDLEVGFLRSLRLCVAPVNGAGTAVCTYASSQSNPAPITMRPGRVVTVTVRTEETAGYHLVVPVTVGSRTPVQWTERSVPAGAHTLDGVACPSSTKCYAVSGATPAVGPGPIGQIIESSNSGDSWQQIFTSQFQFHAIACPSTRACTAVGLELPDGAQSAGAPETLVTTDGGRSWTDEALPSQLGDDVFDVACVSTEECIVTGSEKIARTTDGGSTWTVESLPPGFQTVDSVTCDFFFCMIGGSGPGPMATAPSMYSVSSDGGAGWSTAEVAGGTGSLGQVSCADAQDCVGLVESGGTDTTGSPIVTTDGGKIWTNVSASTGMTAVSCVSSFCASVGRDYHVKTGTTGSSGDAFVSTDGGLRWSSSSLPTSEDLDAVTCLSSVDCVAVGGSSPSSSSGTTGVILTYSS